MRRFSLVTLLLLAALIGCNKPQTHTAQNQADQTQPADVGATPSGDPANGNLASAPESAAPPRSPPEARPEVRPAAPPRPAPKKEDRKEL